MATAKVACSVQNPNLCGSYGEGADLFTSAAISVWHLKDEVESHDWHVFMSVVIIATLKNVAIMTIMLISQCHFLGFKANADFSEIGFYMYKIYI